MDLTPIGIATVAAIGAVAGAAILLAAWMLLPKAGSDRPEFRLPDGLVAMWQSNRVRVIVTSVAVTVLHKHLGLTIEQAYGIVAAVLGLALSDSVRPFKRKTKPEVPQ